MGGGGKICFNVYFPLICLPPNKRAVVDTLAPQK